MIEFTEAIIKHEGNKWILYSHKGEKLGTFDSEEAAKKREKQINYFKYLDRSKAEKYLIAQDYRDILQKYFGG